MKLLLKIALACLLMLCLLAGLGPVLLDSMLATAITASVGYVTQQETTLESVELGLFSGEFGLRGLRIANPPGFGATPLFTLGSFETTLEPRSLASDTIEIHTLELDGVQLALEWRGSQSNLKPLLARLAELQTSALETSEPEAAEPEEDGAGGPALHIERIRIAGCQTRLQISGVPLADGVYELNLPEIVLEDFGSDMDRATAAEWTAHILQSLIERAQAAGQGIFPDAWQDLLRDGLPTDALKRTGKELLEEAREDPAGFLKAHEQDAKDLRKLWRGRK